MKSVAGASFFALVARLRALPGIEVCLTPRNPVCIAFLFCFISKYFYGFSEITDVCAIPLGDLVLQQHMLFRFFTNVTWLVTSRFSLLQMYFCTVFDSVEFRKVVRTPLRNLSAIYSIRIFRFCSFLYSGAFQTRICVANV